MIQGVRIDTAVRDRLIIEVEGEIAKRKQFIKDVLGHPLNPASPKQMKALFYEDLKQPVIFTRATKDKAATPTLGDEALVKIALREPLLKPLITAISDIRTLGIFLSNFLLAPLDEDGRMRCSYNIGGSASGKSAPKTYRLSSSENAFGGGANLQTIPSEKSKSLNKAKARGTIALLGDPYAYPNLRTMFIPDPGKTFFDGDLDRADLQVVCWEADDEMLKIALRQGIDVHLLNAFVLQDKGIPPMEELVETHPKYPDHRGPLKSLREFAKTFCHGTNYLGQPRTMSAHTGWTVHAIEKSQNLWFAAHPGIKKWHERVIAQVSRHRFVENRFGYRWYIFDRTESIMPEAVAWIPQSTVSVVINRIWRALDPWGFDGLYRDRDIEVSLQTHDSLSGQFPTEKKAAAIQEILRCGRVVIPYEDPLVIPFSVKTSEVSWGECT